MVYGRIMSKTIRILILLLMSLPILSSKSLAHLRENSPAQYQKLTKAALELSRLEKEELLWKFRPDAPCDLNTAFPGVLVNDQIGFYYNLSDVQLLLGGSRSGKTEIIVKKVLDIASGRYPDPHRDDYPIPENCYNRFRLPNNGRIIAPKYEDNIRDVILEKIKYMVRRTDLDGGRWGLAFHEKQRLLCFKNGSVIRFFSYDQDPDVFSGKDVDWVWMDQHCPKTKVYVENFTRTVDRNGILMYSFAPDKGVTWEKAEILDWVGIDPAFASFEFRMKGNPHLDAGGVAKAESVIRNSKLRAGKMDGKMVPLSGLVYENFSAMRNVKKVADLNPDWKGELPKTWFRMCVADPHEQKPHYTAVFAVSPEGELILERESQFASPQGVQQYRKHIRTLCSGLNIGKFIFDKSRGGKSINNRGQKTIGEQLKDNDVIEKTGDEIPGTGLPFVSTSEIGASNWESTWNMLTELIAPNEISGNPRFYILDSCPLAIFMFQNCVWRDDPTEIEALSEKVKPVNTEAPDVSRYAAAAMPTRVIESAKPFIHPSAKPSEMTGVV